MGMGAGNTLERVYASMGLLDEVEIGFEPSLDVTYGGVLFALPALLVSGLLDKATKYFELPRGYYGLKSIFLLLAFMVLVRLKSMESLRYCAPGEWGKILGLDRVPEVRTLRGKVAILSEQGAPEKWGAELCAQWMESADSEYIGAFYVDGHVKVYHGQQTKLPRHYVSRQKLCLRATTDYWVNAMDGQPFFKVNRAIDPGILQVLEKEIVPRLQQQVPNQPTKEQLTDNPYSHRFTLIFDREGYSPGFMLKMKTKRIACITYHKYPDSSWPQEEFHCHKVKLASGNIIEMDLAERGTYLGGKLWVREVRKLTKSGHQTSILATDYSSDLAPVAAAMFARWSQENFFKYMREHYNLDALIDYNLEDIPGTTKVVNPDYRSLDSAIRSKNGKLNYLLSQFGAMNLVENIETKRIDDFQNKKAALFDEISALQHQIQKLKKQRSAIPAHITVSDLPEEARFKKLATHSKHFIDTIKMIAYRAETAMAHVVSDNISREKDARGLLRAIYAAEADIIPDQQKQTLTVKLHHLANQYSTNAVQQLCHELNSTHTIFPGTNLRLVYKMVS